VLWASSSWLGPVDFSILLFLRSRMNETVKMMATLARLVPMPIPAFVPVLSPVDMDDGDAELVGSVVVAGDDDRDCEDLEEVEVDSGLSAVIQVVSGGVATVRIWPGPRPGQVSFVGELHSTALLAGLT
jgi:hypothetical protein